MHGPWTFAPWSALNRMGHAWRRLTFRPRAGLRLPEQPWETLFPAGSTLSCEAERLRARYGLDWLDEHENQRENLHVVGLLEAALEPVASSLPGRIAVLDIGAKDWHYLPGLWRCLCHLGTPRPREVEVTGLEADPYYRYRDGFTRHDYAMHYARGLPASYVVGDARRHEGQYDLVLVMHPFWREREVLDWGLPGSYFDIDGLLRHARSLVRPGGFLLVTAYRSESLWAGETIVRLGWTPEAAGEWRSPFVRATASLHWVFRG